MFTDIDEGHGLVKTTWDHVRKRASKVDATLTKIIDSLNPKNLPLYLAYYPYGKTIADATSPFIPSIDGNFFRLSDPSIHPDIQKNLGYGKFDLPLGLALEKNFELFIDLKEQNLTIPHTFYKPGSIFSFLSNMNKRTEVNYSTNSVYTLTAGARSTFMLPNIECATHHANLQRDFNIKIPVAKSLYQHGEVFREIANSPLVNCDWRACILFFSEGWLKKLHEDKSWAPLKLYLHEKAWKHFQHDISSGHYDFIYSIIQKKGNLRQNPYMVDTARHLLSIAMGGAIGYIPATDETSLPLNVLQKIFTESYHLLKYIPTIIQPAYYNYYESTLPVYYSLLYPSTKVFSPNARKVSSTLFSLRELSEILRIFCFYLAENNGLCDNQLLNVIAKTASFKYFHNEKDQHNIIMPSSEMPKYDYRLADEGVCSNAAKFASDARFVRGCISLQNGKKEE